MPLLEYLIIGILAGWSAGRLMRGHRFGLIGDLIVGVIGSMLGAWVFGLLGLGAYGPVGAFVTAVVGAMLFLYLLRFVR